MKWLPLALLCAPAYAQTAHVGGPVDAAYATLHVYNGGSPAVDRVTTHETELGPVVIRYVSTDNSPCFGATPFPPEHCADYVEVISLPDGVMADPWEAEVLEGETLVIHLIEYAGM
jgi:hypothetical protein